MALEIITTYFKEVGSTEVMKNNRSSDPNKAILYAVDHLQHNHYKAAVAQVYSRSLALHGEVIRSAMGVVTITYKRKVRYEYRS